MIALVAGEAKPKPKAAGLISLVQRSSTVLPNHVSTQVAALNVNPAVANYYNNPLIRSYNPYQHYAGLGPYSGMNFPLYNTLNQLPLYGGGYHPNFNLLGGYSYPNNLLSYTLSPSGDSGWTFAEPVVGINAYNGQIPYNNLLALSNPALFPLSSRIPYTIGSLGYPLGLPADLSSLDLSALERLKYNNKRLGEESLFQVPTYHPHILAGAALHNAQTLGKSKESSDYKKNSD